MMIDKNRTYKTRDGREVRIYATDGGLNGDSVHGAIKNDVVWLMYAWSGDGKYNSPENHAADLIEVRPRIKRTVWLNMYPMDEYNAFATRAEADEVANAHLVAHDRLACVRVEIDCEEGTGL